MINLSLSKTPHLKVKILPLYKLNNVQFIAVYNLNNEVVKYISHKYQKYKLVHLTKKEIDNAFDVLKTDNKFCKEINLYSKMSFIPIFNLNKTQFIAINRLSDKILKYVSHEYRKYKFIYFTKKQIRRRLFNSVYKEDDTKCSAKYINNNIAIIAYILITLLFFLYTPQLVFYINILYLITIIFKLAVTLKGCIKKEENYLQPIHFPIYSVLIPIHNEKATTIKSLIKAIEKIDYPKEKLEVKIIIEENDSEILQYINTDFDVIIVPYSFPQTKAKACNYALNFVKGKYVTVYDADDRPNPLQLKKALNIFQNNQDISCIQAPLNYFNYNKNHLTRFFALEYSNNFDFILHGLKKLKLPILLGGTSNHFQVQTLKDVKAWDPYNVTEDADLGIKLHRKRKNSIYIMHDNTTWEESPIKIYSWIKQRSRWIKGFIITYIVHMREPFKLIFETGLRSFLALQLLISIPIIINLFTPIVLIVHLISRIPISNFIIINLLLYFFLTFLTSILSIKYRKWYSLLPYSILIPFYNILHSAAAYRALWQLLTTPYKWDKTEHDQK